MLLKIYLLNSTIPTFCSYSSEYMRNTRNDASTKCNLNKPWLHNRTRLLAIMVMGC